jgi:hypothetical protein
MRFRNRFHGAVLAAAMAMILSMSLPAGPATAGVPKVVLAEDFGHVL